MNMNDRERTLTDDSLVVGPVKDNSPAWLNEVGAVSGIVKAFASDFIRRYGIVEHGSFVRWLENECFRMNSLFIGEGLETMPYRRGPWNTPDQLGHHLALSMKIDGEQRFAARDAFMVFSSKIGQLMRDNQGDESMRKLQSALDKETSEFATILLGADGVTW